MKPLFALPILFTAFTVAATSSSESAPPAPRQQAADYDVQPFKIDLSDKFAELKKRVKSTRLPSKPQYPGSEDLGINLEYLTALKSEWVDTYDWDKEQQNLNSYKQYTVAIEGIDLHFIHEKSEVEDSIPIILNHGWPGSIHEFIPVIRPLTRSATLASGKNVSFHVVVPSLPGFVFSSAAPANWTVSDTARIFNTLMVDVLGYPTYAVHGTDWGSGVAFSLFDNFNSTVRAAHLDFIPFLGPTPEQAAAENITLSEVGIVGTKRLVNYQEHQFSYFTEQEYEPNTIGYALYDSPVGQLSWIGNGYKQWSDPRAGTSPSVLDNASVLTVVSLYYLTDSFVSAAYIYAQNPGGFNPTYFKARTDAPLLFTNFQYNLMYWPREYVERVGNVVYFQEYDFGGHFAGLDNPPALIDDLRHIGDYFKAN